METRTVEQVEGWKTRPFSDGFAGLRELSDGEFSGAVEAGGAWLFMLNGRIIGVYEGSLDDFEDATGTAYAAPHPSLPLVFSMQEQGGETQAKYYTNDTPLSEVDSTLTDGKFTGYIELSENVLSGDYYVAYYGGRSMSVAFVGASEQVVTGEEAFERADDEVGIYEVRDVDIDVIDVPEPDEPDEPDAPNESPGGASGPTDTSDASGLSGAGGTGGPSPESGTGGTGGPSPDSGVGGAGQSAATDSADSPGPAGQSSAPNRQSASKSTAADAETGRTADAGVESSAPAESPTPAESPSSESNSGGPADSGRSTATDSGVATEASATERAADVAGTNAGTAVEPAETAEPEESADPARPESGQADAKSGASESATDAPADSAAESATDEDGSDAFEEEEQWREATTIPSLDPDRSEGPADEETADSDSIGTDADSAAATGGSAAGVSSQTSSGTGSSSGSSPTGSQSGSRAQSGTGGQSADAQSDAGAQSGPGSRSGSAPGGASGQSSAPDEKAQAQIQKLRSQLRQRKQQVEQLKERLSNVESERNEYKRERDALRQEVERLEAKLESSGSDGSGASGRQLSRSQAFDGTNLFVRYESKGKATLEEAAASEAKPEDVNENLRLEHHTQFETEGATVEGEPFEEFLHDSFEYQFVSWVIEELLYEIRDTGHRNGLKDLYESIPKIDRVDLHGSVGAGDDTEDTRQESFDIIMRDRMGNPLVVADLNDSRDPTTGDMMGSLVDASSGVGKAHDELSGAFQVTESFFQPKALETAENATAGGFLSREKRESFVKLSRKRGYHLCLVESRSGGFHLNVPEL
ncbi:DUF7527 domain-containing protein [Halorussus ruber]|uniref:DUF7527 domain-containing protein n=1 Tax=Halorussus ruber TaxID=1126238 RepID=UPI0010928A96|nr:transcriptional regulator [Halorussus ruber]